MRDRIVFVGSMREEPIHLVRNKGINRRYHKSNGQLIEYECVSKYDEIPSMRLHYASVLLCMNQLEDVRKEQAKARCKRILYVPELSAWNLDVLFSFVKKGNVDCEQGKGIGLAFQGDTLGKQIMEMLIHFPLIESGTTYYLYLGVRKRVEIEELTRMEDIIKEYIPLGSRLYINQIILKNPEQNYYFLLFV